MTCLIEPVGSRFAFLSKSTIAKPVLPSFEICPVLSNGLITWVTCGDLRDLGEHRRVARARPACFRPSSARTTIWSRSPDWAGKRLVSRSAACCESVFPSEKLFAKCEPAARQPPKVATIRTIQRARTTRRWSEHQRLKASMGAWYTKRSDHSVFSAILLHVKTLRSDALRNHERLVASARELFARSGVDVPVEEITHHAGLGMGTLYRHFPTKEDLIDAVLEDAFAEIVAIAEQAAAEEDAWVGFCQFLEQALALHARNRRSQGHPRLERARPCAGDRDAQEAQAAAAADDRARPGAGLAAPRLHPG